MGEIRTLIFIITTSLMMFLTNCTSYQTDEKVEFGKACDGENRNEDIKVEGYIINESVSCSDDFSGQRSCGLALSESNDKEGSNINFSLQEGKTVNQIETSESDAQSKKSSNSFTIENVKIRSNNGSIIDLKKKVAISGKTTIHISSTMMPVCEMKVDKIEQ